MSAFIKNFSKFTLAVEKISNYFKKNVSWLISIIIASPYMIWMALFVVSPLIIVVVFAFTTDNGSFSLIQFQGMGEYAGVFGRSIWLAVIATAICLILGYPLAYILARETGFISGIAMLLIMLPMWMNFLLRTYAWMSLLELNGLINKVLSFFLLPTLNIINTESAVVLGMVYNYLPFMVLPIYSVITKIDRSLIEAAQDLGSTPITLFRRIVLPLSLPGVLSGITMVFVPSVSTFIISKMLGGGANFLLGDLIEMQFLGNAYNPHLGAAISLVMMVIVLVCLSVMHIFGEGEEEVQML